MDDADRAQVEIERGLEAAIAAARGIVPTPGLRCRACTEPLVEGRRVYGICVDCQRDLERMQQTGVHGR